MKNRKIIYSLMLSLMLVFVACSDNIGDNIYTAKQELIGEYLHNHPETYSEFYAMLEKTDMLGLLNSYGEYTCFAPTNEAVISYFSKTDFGSINNFPVDSLKKVVLYQLIENDTITSQNFQSARLRTTNMMGDYLQVKWDGSTPVINNTASILLRDGSLKNGVLHMTNAVLVPDTSNVAGKLESAELNGRFTIFAEALKETGVGRLLQKSIDPEVFSYTYTKDERPVTVTIPKQYRYTVLAESNDTYNAAGIFSFEDLKDRYDDGKGGITSKENGLYRFIAYHCLNRLYDYSQFIKFSQQDGYEIVETMCENTLLEFRNTTEGVIFNRFTNAEETVIYPGTKITGDNNYRNIMSNNGMIHELTGILEIPDQTKYFNKKMRFNVAAFLPELMNGGYRGVKTRELPNAVNYGSKGLTFFDNLRIVGEAGCVVSRYDYTAAWVRHQYDEILIGSGYQNENWDQEPTGTLYKNTRYDVYLTLPPIPKGINWEIRFGYTSNEYRGMAQLYFDGRPAGVPLWLGQVDRAYYGVEGMDQETARRVLYNNSYMPYPSNIAGTTYTDVSRMRRIIGTYSFNEMEKHVLRLKAVEPGQLSLNFIEIIPVDQIENEDYN